MSTIDDMSQVDFIPTPIPPEVTNAVSNVVPGVGFTPGETYYVNDAEDLKALETLVESGVSTDGINFVQTGTIDMSGETFRGIGATNGWKMAMCAR